MPESIVDGTLELQDSGGGFLRSPKRNYAVHPTDAFVPDSMIKRFHLRGGETLNGLGGANGHGGRSRQVVSSLESVNGLEPAAYSELTDFADLTVIDPTSRLRARKIVVAATSSRLPMPGMKSGMKSIPAVGLAR